MKTIPRETVTAIAERYEHLEEDKLQPLFARFAEEQPFLMTYLLVGDEEFVEEESRGDLLYLGLMVYQILSNEHGGLPTAPEDVVIEADDANMQMLSGLEESSEMAFEAAIEKMIANFNQLHVLGAMLEILMTGNEETPDLAPESIGMNLIHLKTVIDCLDR